MDQSTTSPLPQLYIMSSDGNQMIRWSEASEEQIAAFKKHISDSDTRIVKMTEEKTATEARHATEIDKLRRELEALKVQHAAEINTCKAQTDALVNEKEEMRKTLAQEQAKIAKAKAELCGQSDSGDPIIVKMEGN